MENNICEYCNCKHPKSLSPIFNEPLIWDKKKQALNLTHLLPPSDRLDLDPSSERPVRRRRLSYSASNITQLISREAQRHAVDALVAWVNKTISFKGLYQTLRQSALDIVSEIERQRSFYLEKWERLVDDVLDDKHEGHPRYPLYECKVEPPSKEWTVAQSYLTFAAKCIVDCHASDLGSCERSIASQLCDFLYKYPSVLEDWSHQGDTQYESEVTEFRLCITTIRKSIAQMSGFGTHNQTDFCHSFHPELFNLHGVRVDDVVVPHMWRGLGFGSILGYMESRMIERLYSPLSYILFTHVHRPLYAITVGKRLPGYTEWLPVEESLQKDPVLQSFLLQHASDSGNLAMQVYTEYYGDASLFYDNFNLLWKSPLAVLMEQFTHPTLSMAKLVPNTPCVRFPLLRKHFSPGEVGFTLLDIIGVENRGGNGLHVGTHIRLTSDVSVRVDISDNPENNKRILVFVPYFKGSSETLSYKISPARPWLISLAFLLAHYCTAMNAHRRVRSPNVKYTPVCSIAVGGLGLHGKDIDDALEDFEHCPLPMSDLFDEYDDTFSSMNDEFYGEQ